MKKKDHFTVHLYKYYERFFGRGVYHNFCVSKAMQQDLIKNWGIKATVLYDKATRLYKPAELKDRHHFFETKIFGQPPDPLLNARHKVTAFTSKKGRTGIELRPDRPALIVSSSSWTEDENFDLLLDAMLETDKIIKKEGSQLKIRLVITGKGDLKEYYEKKIDALNLENVLIYTTFLSYPEYATLLGSADIGICLHVSSSGLDLPMKVVDMYGCHLPVCAIYYPALPELVKHDKTGLIFHNSSELAKQIFDLLKDFPLTLQLDKMRNKIAKLNEGGWEEEWKNCALSVFK